MKGAGLKAARVVVLVVAGLASVGWLDAIRDRVASGNRLYFRGQYEEAEKAYGEGLVDFPESDILHYNLAAAQYRQGKFTEVLETLAKVKAGEETAFAAEVAYNRGNAEFKLAAASEADDPQAALGLYGQALVSYRRAMALDPSDIDSKFNHELVEKRMAKLKKRIEEEKKNQDEKENQDKPEQQQPPADGSQPEGKQGNQEQEPGEEPEQQQAKGEQANSGEEKGAGEKAGESGQEQMSPEQARALVDAVKEEELDPSDLARQMIGAAGLGEPTHDW